MIRKSLLASTIAMTSLSAAAATTPTLEELAAQLRTQQAQIEALTAEVEKKGASGTGNEWFRNTTLGGYGELHFSHNKRTKGNDANSPVKGDPNGDSIDFHRFVLFIGHQYSDTVRFFSELELEHSLAGESKPGEVELEQAYIEWDYAQNHRLVAGQFLLPIGYFNETHEPETFYGVERPSVEGEILGAVWWEGGAMAKGELGSAFKYDVAATSGLNDPTGNMRSGRQKVAKANAEDHAYTARLRYVGVPGLDVGATYQRQQDITQGICAGGDKCGQADLMVGHVAWKQGGLGLRAVYAEWEVEGLTNGAGDQWGWYVEPSYKITPKVGVFARYSEWDKSDGVGSTTESRSEQVVAGANFWLTERVVFKFDVINENNTPNRFDDKEGYNLGVGYSF
ncbi:MAG: phosphate-selective porin [Moraxellaceae bacterium]|jgi:hypothetical protein|nr:phosphate-selective porin [Moraxellaceae bacterium]